MKYFTAELYARLQDRSKEATTREAMQAWDVATSQYNQELQALLPKLPKGMRALVGSGSLHDAKVLAIWLERIDRLKMVLQKERELSKILVLEYHLSETPQVNTSTLAEAYRTATPAWLYDEIGTEIPSAATKLIFTHRILLSNGWEAYLRFQRMKISTFPRLIPGRADFGFGADGIVPQSA